uniref:Protein NDRG2 n=1 Tax=Kryptolebias marmoratus TaxID=37003 RepID=A0A3Q3BK42_KRYMA
MVLEENDSDSVFEPHITDEHVETQYGDVHCVMTGTVKPNRPVILTLPDVGLNHKSCYESLFTHEDMQEIVRHLPVCHVEAPGQHEGAKTLPAVYTYPSMEQISEMLPDVLKHFGLRSVVGMGVGAGAYILAKFAVSFSLFCCLNASQSVLQITDWTHTLPDKILTHMFGKDEIQTNHELVATYRHYITTTMNQSNVSQFLRSYNSRSALEMERPPLGANTNVKTLTCSTLLVVGDNSPAVEAVVECNSKLNPTKTTFLKMADCGGLPQVDQPAKVIEALKYFIQGMGHLSSASMTRLRSRTGSGSSTASHEGPRSRAHTDELQRGRTHSHGAEKHGHTHTSMENVSTVNQSASKSTEVAC